MNGLGGHGQATQGAPLTNERPPPSHPFPTQPRKRTRNGRRAARRAWRAWEEETFWIRVVVTVVALGLVAAMAWIIFKPVCGTINPTLNMVLFLKPVSLDWSRRGWDGGVGRLWTVVGCIEPCREVACTAIHLISLPTDPLRRGPCGDHLRGRVGPHPGKLPRKMKEGGFEVRLGRHQREGWTGRSRSDGGDELGRCLWLRGEKGESQKCGGA